MLLDLNGYFNFFVGGIDALGTVVAEVELADGTTGVGISIGGEPACFIIEVRDLFILEVFSIKQFLSV